MTFLAPHPDGAGRLASVKKPGRFYHIFHPRFSRESASVLLAVIKTSFP